MSPLRRWLLLALLIGGVMINYADRQIIALLKPLIGADFRLDDADYGHITAAYQLSAAVSLLFAGWLIDRIGVMRGNPIVVGTWSLFAMGHGLVRSLVQLAGMRIALGVAEAPNTPLTVKSIALLCRPEDRSLAFAAMNAASTAGAIVTPFIVPPLALAFGWRAAFIIVGGVGLLWVVAWLAASRGVVIDNPPAARPGAASPSWRDALTDRRTWAVAGAKVLSDQVWWLLLYWSPDLLRRLFHRDVDQIAVPIGIMYLCAIAGSLGGGAVSRLLLVGGRDLDRARKLTLLVCALLATPLGLVTHVGSVWAAVALLGLTLAAHQGFSVNLFTLIADIIPQDRLGTVTSIGVLAGNLGGMTILAVTGSVVSHSGGYGPLLWIAGFSYLAALLWIHLLLPVVRSADGEG